MTSADAPSSGVAVAPQLGGVWPYGDATRSIVTVLPASFLLLGGIAAAALVRSVFKPR